MSVLTSLLSPLLSFLLLAAPVAALGTTTSPFDIEFPSVSISTTTATSTEPFDHFIPAASSNSSNNTGVSDSGSLASSLLIAGGALLGAAALKAILSALMATAAAQKAAAVPKPSYPNSFGGTIVAVYNQCQNGNRWFEIAPAGGDPNIFYIMTPGTVIQSITPPSMIGQQVLGLAGGFGDCVITYYPYKMSMPYGEMVISVGASGL